MKKIIAFFFLLLSASPLWACTTFLLKGQGQLVFGRNYDWITGSGMVNVNPRGLHKRAGTTDNPAAWTSAWGSITFNQYGREYPTGGMNEKGLVVELMWLENTKYAASDARSAVGGLQWIQYQLDCCATVEEVVATDAFLRVNESAAPLHYLVADADGNAATIEFLNGKMVVHKDDQLPLPVLTNDTYAASEAAYKSNRANGDNSLERFATACSMVSRFETEKKVSAVDYAFGILNKVAQGDYTVWSIVYDIANRQVFFKTAGNPQQKSFRFSGFDFSCNMPAKVYVMNQPSSGDITTSFIPYSAALNRQLIETTFSTPHTRIPTTKQEIEDLIVYPESVVCKTNN
jgi:penicillin V acylase-like amidase (Ntn superfamily)